MPDPDFQDTWVDTSGKRHHHEVNCNCPAGEGQAACLADCEAEFDEDMELLKEKYPPA